MADYRVGDRVIINPQASRLQYEIEAEIMLINIIRDEKNRIIDTIYSVKFPLDTSRGQNMITLDIRSKDMRLS